MSLFTKKQKGQRPVRTKLAAAAMASIESMESRVLMSTTLANWTFETSAPVTAGPVLPELEQNTGTSAALGVHAGGSTYSSPAGNGSSHSFSSTTWAANDYYQFKTSAAGFQGISFAWDQTSSNTGPGQFQVSYSTNGTTFTNVGGLTTVLANGASPNAAWNGTTPSAAYTASVDFSTITALNNSPTVFIRLTDASTVSANGGVVASGGTDRVDNVSIIAASAVVTTNPTVTSISPSAGPLAGGTLVTINGSNFTNTSTVSFGGGAAITPTFVSSSQLKVNSPAHASGAVDITVTNGAVTSATSGADKFTYSASGASVTGVTDTAGIVAAVSPAVAYNGGGTQISIAGTGFTGATGVTVNGVAASAVTVVSDTQITATVSATANGTYPVVVQSPTGNGTGGSLKVVGNIAALQSLGAPTPAPTVSLDPTDNPVVTYIASKPGTVQGVNYNSYAVLVTDSSGSMELFGSALGSYTPVVGDVLSIAGGTWSPFHQIPEFTATSSSAISKIGTTSVPVIPTTTVDAINDNPLTNANAGHLVTLTNATITGEGASFGTTNSPTSPAATISDGAGVNNSMQFFYWPTSYSQDVTFFNGTAVPTTPVSITGIVSVFNNTAEFTPMFINGVTPETFSMANNATAVTVDTTHPDGFKTIARGNAVTVTVTRNQSADIADIDYTEIADSASAGVDYTTVSGTLNFPVGVSSKTFTINTSATSTGDKIFSIALSNARSETSGFQASYTGGLGNVVIDDPNTFSVQGNNSINGSTGENATVQSGGPSTNTTSFTVEANNTTNTTFASYGVLDYNDQANDPSHVFSVSSPIGSITGVELETVAIPASFEVSGPLNVYIVTDTTSSIVKATSTLKFDSANDAIEGLGTQFGSHYLLGTINYSASQQPGAYTPYNLTNLDATGVSLLQNAITNNVKFRIVVTPGNAATSASWQAFNSANSFPDLSPVIRVNYNAPGSLPAWLASGSAATWNAAGKTLTVTGATTIIADPGTDLPKIVASGAAAQVTVQLPVGTFSNIHVGGIQLSSGAGIDVKSVSGRAHSKHNVLVIGALNASASPTISVDSASKINLEDNDLIVHTGTSDSDGQTELGVVQGLAATGRHVAPGGFADGTWTGNGLTSSAAAAADAGGFELNVLAVEDNSDRVLLGALSKWVVGAAQENLGANDILVKYTYNGDTALEGLVGDNSAGVVGAFYTPNTPGFNDYAFGDLNGDGKVDDQDAGILSALYGLGTGGDNGAQL